MECRVFQDNSATEFRGILQMAPRNLAKFAAENGGPDYQRHQPALLLEIFVKACHITCVQASRSSPASTTPSRTLSLLYASITSTTRSVIRGPSTSRMNCAECTRPDDSVAGRCRTTVQTNSSAWFIPEFTSITCHYTYLQVPVLAADLNCRVH